MARLVKLFLGIVGAGIVVGACLGMLIGAVSPAFVRWALGDSPWISPIRDGLALGISNGVLFGVVGGALVTLAVAIAERRS